MAKELGDPYATTTLPHDDALRCAVCDHRITDRAYRCEQAGAHAHTFVNPAGIQFEIGCFVAAPGCGYAGAPSEEFSWFPGWSWQIALCTRCRSHVGWLFRCGGDQFHGLIFAALRG